ncbi:hypothetical protein J8J14_00020 [Roseomonas sp. SSH11]|uniref:Uncharacterized protein n=1 Tax=Pararoseomonas baculiformis TaxID=2820812 RepID=A0ABS4A822_9PROT|nr:hypothetical protein [Pararoseomonas baculiformis]MBP0443149.1 hypothetical protein [Pararoseomonas baculiformis]
MPDLIPDAPSPAPRPEPKLLAQQGKHGGPSWTYRGATIHSNEKGTLFSLENGPADLPGQWNGVGTKQLLIRVLDSWLDEGKLPPPYSRPSQVGEDEFGERLLARKGLVPKGVFPTD